MSDSSRKTLRLPTKNTVTALARPPIRSNAQNRRNKTQTANVSAPGNLKPFSAAHQTKPARDSSPPHASSPLPGGKIRLSKLMAERGLCSRREADSFIEKGWVFVDGQRITTLGTRVDPDVAISLDKAARTEQQQRVTILLHKPVGYVSGQPEPGFTPAVTLIRPENQWPANTPSQRFHPSHLKGLAPAGRLDIDSSGLLVFTQDGRIAKHLIGEDSTVDKEYLVRVAGQLGDKGLALLNHGLSLDGKALKPTQVSWINEDQLHFVLVEGKKRQIRRMCELVGLRVIGLKRVRIGNVRLGNLPPGQWRYLDARENF